VACLGTTPHHISPIISKKEVKRGYGTYILNKLPQSRFATDETLRTADDVVAIGKQACDVGGRFVNHVENVPDVFSKGEG